MREPDATELESYESYLDRQADHERQQSATAPEPIVYAQGKTLLQVTRETVGPSPEVTRPVSRAEAGCCGQCGSPLGAPERERRVLARGWVRLRDGEIEPVAIFGFVGDLPGIVRLTDVPPKPCCGNPRDCPSTRSFGRAYVEIVECEPPAPPPGKEERRG